MFVEPRCGFVCLISKGVGLFVGTCLNVNLFVCGDREQVCLFVRLGLFLNLCVSLFVCLSQGVEILFVVPGCGKLIVSPPKACICLFVEPGCEFVCLWSQGVSLFV